MLLERIRTLRDIVADGGEQDPIALINCPPTFNLQSHNNSRDSAAVGWLQAYSASPPDRYLDDLVSNTQFLPNLLILYRYNRYNN